MKCPICKDKELKPKTIQQIDLDVCEYCSGYWFDSGEIEAYRTKVQSLFSPRVPNISGFVSALNTSSKECPRCEQLTLQFGTVGVSSIYKCSRCTGYFFDMQNSVSIDLGDLLATILTSMPI